MTNEEVLEALKASGGFITEAARRLGVEHSTVSRRIKRSKKLQKVLEATVERYLDISEFMLLTNIMGGDQRAIEFFLDRKGKSRGYGAPGKALPHDPNFVPGTVINNTQIIDRRTAVMILKDDEAREHLEKLADFTRRKLLNEPD